MRRVVVTLSWVPLALYVVASVYVQRFEGWGRWAAAPVFLPAMVMSLVLSVAGLFELLLGLRRDAKIDSVLMLATLLASSVLLYLWLRAT